MSKQAFADGVFAAADQASNPQAHITSSGQDLEVQQHAHVLGHVDIEDDDLESMLLSWSISSVSKGLSMSQFSLFAIYYTISTSDLHNLLFM